MWPYVVLFSSAMIVALSGAMMPGPLLTVTISESSRRGAMAGPILIFGHAVLELALIIALFLGLGPILQNNVFFIIVALVGGIIMLLMGWGMFRSIPSLSLAENVNVDKKNNLFVAGVLMSLANPYWIVWWATIGIGYLVSAQRFGFVGIFSFYLGHILGDLLWYSAISMAVAKGKKLFTDRAYKGLIAVCAGFLVIFSIYLVVSGIKMMK